MLKCARLTFGALPKAGTSTVFGIDESGVPRDLGDGLTTRLMPRVYQADPPRWELRRDGIPIGYIKPTRIGRSRTIFYEAIGYLADTGEGVSLELTTDFTERCRTILSFNLDPASSVHLPRRYRRTAHQPSLGQD